MPITYLKKALLFFYFEVTDKITKEKLDRFGYIKNCKHMYNNKNKILRSADVKESH